MLTPDHSESLLRMLRGPLPAIFVMRVRDGEIVSSRDYHDAIASARARGQLGELFAAVTGDAGGAGR